MAGITTPPMAAVSAAAEPEMPAMIIEATMAAAASPPGAQPTRLLQKSIRRREIPPTSMMEPAIMNSGTASRSNESTPENSCCTMVWPSAEMATVSGKTPGVTIRPMAGKPIDSAIGKPSAISKNIRANCRMMIMRPPACFCSCRPECAAERSHPTRARPRSGSTSASARLSRSAPRH